MNDNEAINTLQYLLGYENAVDNGDLETPNNLNSQEKEALRMIIEEIQQYRAIGTVESLKSLPAICDSLAESSMKAEKLIEELKEYRAIGTIEELQALKEKNEPKKPNRCVGFMESLFVCPSCGRKQAIMYEQYHCKECGQALDWSE